MPDGPQERRHFAGDRRHDDGQLLARGAEPAVAGAKADLRFPGDIADGLRQSLQSGSQSLGDPCGIAICPGRLDQSAAGTAVARQGEAFPPDRLAGRTLRWDKAEGPVAGVVGIGLA